MRRIAALAVLVAAAAGCPDKAPEDTPPVAQLVSVSGMVKLTRAGSSTAAAPGPLFTEDVLTTGADGRALLRDAEGHELELGADTRFRLESKLGGVQLEVMEGVITLVGGEGSDKGLRIATPHGAATVTKGTKGTVEVGEHGLSIQVSFGEVTLVDEDGGTNTAKAGQKLWLKMGSFSVVQADAPAAAPAAPPAPIEGVSFIAEQGTPALKAKGQKAFVRVGKAPVAVADGTLFKVPPASRGRLETQGLAVHLEAGASGTVGARQDVDGRGQLQLKMGGAARVAFGGSKPMALALAGSAKPVQLVATHEAAVAVVQTPRCTKLEVLAGEVEIVTAQGSPKASAGETADACATGVEVHKRPRPFLVLPAGKRVSVFSFALPQIGLAVPAEPHRVEVSADPGFADPILSGEAKGFVVVASPSQGRLHWRALDPGGTPAKEGSARFLPIDPTTFEQAERTDTVAETGLKATVFAQGQVPTLTFNFAPQEGAKSYRLTVYRTSDLKTPALVRQVTENRATVESGALGEGNYAWYAAALDAAGTERGGGKMNKMEIVFENSLTALRIAHPRPGERASATTSASGMAPLGAKLFINDKPAPLDEKGRFSIPLGKVEAAVFRLVDEDGAERYWVTRLSK